MSLFNDLIARGVDKPERLFVSTCFKGSASKLFVNIVVLRPACNVANCLSMLFWFAILF